MQTEELVCREFVELVTDYLEGALPPEERARIDAHLDDCSGCRAYLEEIRDTIRLSGKLDPESISPAARDALLEVFRGRRRAAPG